MFKGFVICNSVQPNLQTLVVTENQALGNRSGTSPRPGGKVVTWDTGSLPASSFDIWCIFLPGPVCIDFPLYFLQFLSLLVVPFSLCFFPHWSEEFLQLRSPCRVSPDSLSCFHSARTKRGFKKKITPSEGRAKQIRGVC